MHSTPQLHPASQEARKRPATVLGSYLPSHHTTCQGPRTAPHAAPKSSLARLPSSLGLSRPRPRTARLIPRANGWARARWRAHRPCSWGRGAPLCDMGTPGGVAGVAQARSGVRHLRGGAAKWHRAWSPIFAASPSRFAANKRRFRLLPCNKIVQLRGGEDT
jgi:hypothetical protein